MQLDTCVIPDASLRAEFEKNGVRPETILPCGIPVREEAFTVAEAMEADELLVVSTSVHGVRITEIDGKPVCGRDGALAERLQRLFRAYFWASVGQPGRQ